MNLLTFLIPGGKRLLHVEGDSFSFLEDLEAAGGWLLSSSNSSEHASSEGGFSFVQSNITDQSFDESFDFALMINVVGQITDLWSAFRNLHHEYDKEQRLVVVDINPLYRPLLKLAGKIGLNVPDPGENRLNRDDVDNLLELNGYEPVRQGYICAFPFYVPLLSSLINTLFNLCPYLHRLGVFWYTVARPVPLEETIENPSVSIIVPAQNERGHVEGAVERTPDLGARTELIFVEGNSSDGTREKITQVMENYDGKKELKLVEQGEGGTKSEAVWMGFEEATGDILMILDGDLTVPPEDMDKFYQALIEDHGDFINGSRLIYPMEEGAMRDLNFLGNHFFARAFQYILGQRITDTLCGTKVLKRTNYEKMTRNRVFPEGYDPFGDYDLLFNAAKNNLKIVDLPVRYRSRDYGGTEIHRFADGWLLLKMTTFALWKFTMKYD